MKKKIIILVTLNMLKKQSKKCIDQESLRGEESPAAPVADTTVVFPRQHG